jgi:gliding-associated putative ABC transporter substrate-binding component GldG
MRKIYTTTVLIIAIIVVINLLAYEFHVRLDLTEGQQYTLSDATKNILDNLEEPVTVKAYFSENLPQAIVKTRTDFQEMLVEYADRADGMIQYEFIDPGKNEATENEALQNGIQPLLINVREKDQVKQQKAFLGVVVILGSKQESIPYMQPGTAMEYSLSTAVKKISIDAKPTVGFLNGHGEPRIDEMPQLMQELNVLYTPQAVSISDTTDIPASISTLVIVRPMDSIPPSHLAQLDAFMSRGGNIAACINRVDGNLQNAYGTVTQNGLEEWLRTKGVEVEPNFVVDAKCGAVTTQQQTPFGMMQQQIPFPYLPIIGKYADHPVSKGLENVMFQFASTIRFVGDTTTRFVPILMSSDKSSFLPAPLYFDVQKNWSEADFTMAGLTMGAAVESSIGNSVSSKMVVIADGDFIINGAGQQQRQLQPDNINLLSNAIDWLSDDTGLIELRTKGVSSRPIDELDASTKTILKYGNFISPLFLVLVYGIVRFQRNRMRRAKRMNLNYEED